MTLAAVVQGLTGRAEIAIVFRFVRETLGTEVRTPLSVYPAYTRQQEECNKQIRVNVGNAADVGNQAQPAIQSYSFALSMPRNVRAELRLFGQVTKSDVERLRKQIEFLEEQFEDEDSAAS